MCNKRSVLARRIESVLSGVTKLRGETGLFDATHANILVLISAGYPDAAPDMFYTLPWVKVSARNAWPRAADHPQALAGQTWQRWSRHINEWRPGIDGIWTMLKRIDHALQVAAWPRIAQR